MTDVEMKTYEVTTTKGRMRFTVPATYKVTYGAIVPGKNGAASSAQFGVRVWETNDKQRMVISEVTSLRDLSIPCMVEAVRKFGDPDDAWYFDDGTYDPALVHKEWKPLDDIREGRIPGMDEEPDKADDDDDAWSARVIRRNPAKIHRSPF